MRGRRPIAIASAPARTAERGFTLMEMLVVMLLTAMITGVLLQGLQQVMQLQQRFGAELYNTQQGAMLKHWFRRSINGVLADYVDGSHPFRGEETRMSGLTLASLTAEEGLLLPFVWRLRFDPQQALTQLTYGEDATQVILAWPGKSGRFRYFDDKGEGHETWPPPLGKWPQLPSAIKLEYESAGERQSIIAVPQTLGDPPLRLKDLQNI